MSEKTLLLLVSLGPLALLAVGLSPTRWANRNPVRMGALTTGAALVALATALLAALCLPGSGPASASLPLLEVAGGAALGLGLYYDAIAAVMLALVAFVGSVVVGYSRRYLGGDPRQGFFFKWLALALSAVLFMLVSGNFAQFTLAWVGMSLALHELLQFYGERPGAVLAARKKFIFSRAADLCVIAAGVLLAKAFGTLEVPGILAAAAAVQAGDVPPPPGLELIAVLIAGAALLKSAQLPFHSWLPQVMETPTPVSALLHAGIINAGGFLVVRFAEVMNLAHGGPLLLAVVGALTALFGALVMLTQNSIKVSLAWSTVAQMGFMLMQCGLGAYAAALLHIVAHSLYKAHAFLSSGSAVDVARAARLPHASVATNGPLGLVSVGLVAAVALAAGAGELTGMSFTVNPGVVALGAILLMSLAPLVAASVSGRGSAYVMVRCTGLAGAVIAAYFALQLGCAALVGDSLPVKGPATLAELAVAGLILVGFAGVVLLQIQVQLHRYEQPWRAFYVHLFNGFYLNLVANRVVEALWPLASNRRETR